MISVAGATVRVGDMFNEFHVAMIVGLTLTIVYTLLTLLLPKCRAARYSGIHSSHYFGLKQLCFAGLM